MSTGQLAITAAVKTLTAKGIPDAARDARKIFAHVMEIDASRVSLILSDPITLAQSDAFARLIARRARREPVSHLIGLRQFYGHAFEVGPDVLDPRPETEILIAMALERPFGRVLDLGTGSGCIVGSLLAARGPDSFGIGTDLSAAALAVAGRNASRLGVSDRVQFHQGSWFDGVPTGQSDFDLIVSNPPYITADEMLALAPEVRDFEPRMALTDEADGLSAYRIICAGAPQHLRPGGGLLVEIGPAQAAAVSEMMQNVGLANVMVTPDLDGRDRVVSAQKR